MIISLLKSKSLSYYLKQGIIIYIIFVIFYSAFFNPFCVTAQEKKPEREPLSEWSKQWLEEVVPYIITKAEKEVFLSLPNELERGRFINLFWRKRDPNPATPQNEYKDEYYRRIALANKYFSYASIPGWRTDRGRIFILLGPPQEIERNFNVTKSSGIIYAAEEIWQYWGLPNPNLPYNFQLTFVDKTGTGNYEIIRDYLSEKALTSLKDITLQFDSMNNLLETEKNPFENLDKIKPTVETAVNYNLIPFEITTFLFKRDDGQAHIPLVLDIPIKNLSSKVNNGKREYSLSLSIQATNSSGQPISQKSLKSNFQLEVGQDPESIQAQTSLTLPFGKYNLNIVLWDNFSGKLGLTQNILIVPNYFSDDLRISDIVFSTTPDIPIESRFSAPKSLIYTKKIFHNEEVINITFEVYGLACSSVDGTGSIRVELEIIKNSEVILTAKPIQSNYANKTDLRIQTDFRIKGLQPGDYLLRFKVFDLVSYKTAIKEVPITVSK